MKKCCGCNKIKDDSEFRPCLLSRDGLYFQCRACLREKYKRNRIKIGKQSKVRYQKNIKKIRSKNRESYQKNREEKLSKAKEYARTHKEEKREYDKKYNKKNKKKIAKREKEKYLMERESRLEKARKRRREETEKVKLSAIKTNYGLTKEDYEAMYVEQEGKCKICGKPEIECKRRLSVDHIHGTEPKLIRGLLCDNCNHGLGKFKDSEEFLMRAAEYVKNKGKIK